MTATEARGFAYVRRKKSRIFVFSPLASGLKALGVILLRVHIYTCT